jgi:predicted aconitase with swiveling domain
MADGSLPMAGELILGPATSGPLLRLTEPVSFWGGVDEKTGRIIDQNHPQFGVCMAGTALLMGAARGSSSSSSTLLECVRLGTAPAMLLLTERDTILPVGVAAAWEIYGRGPSVVLLPEPLDAQDGERIRVDHQGHIHKGPGIAAAGPSRR